MTKRHRVSEIEELYPSRRQASEPLIESVAPLLCNSQASSLSILGARENAGSQRWRRNLSVFEISRLWLRSVVTYNFFSGDAMWITIVHGSGNITI